MRKLHEIGVSDNEVSVKYLFILILETFQGHIHHIFKLVILQMP